MATIEEAVNVGCIKCELSRRKTDFVFKRIKINGGSIMSEENETINQMNELRSHLYQIKILLLILITLCVLGFYAISRSMWDDIAGTTTYICEILIVAVILIAPVLLFIWIRAMNNPLKNESPNKH